MAVGTHIRTYFNGAWHDGDTPVIRAADHGFVVAVDTPQFFPSSVSTIALLETLLSFVIAVGSEEIVEQVETFHRRRHQLGIYMEEPE